MANKSFVFRFADVEVHEREFSIIKAGEVLPVEPKAFRILLILLRNPQKLISKEELLNAVWGDAAVTENSLARSIALLRRLLGDETRNPRYIETVATVGYRWVCKVEVVEELSGPEEAPVAPVGPVSGGQKTERRKRFWVWVLAGGGVLVLCMAGAVWYRHRPLPQPRITGYTRITNDSHEKFIDATDGSRLYFTQMEPNSINQVGIAGGEIAKIPVAVPGFFWTLDISPDGSNLLVASRESVSGDRSVWIVRVLGGTSRRIANGESATFSPDGNSITYTTGEGELRVVQSDGTGDHKLASGESSAYDLHWSPDGKVVRFFRSGVLWDISANGSSLHEVLPGWQYRGRECCGHWASDGKFYVFQTNGQIWALDERRGLFRHPSAEPVQLTTGPIIWNNPIPDKGTNKIFSTGKISHGELCRFDPKTKQLLPFLGGISAQDVSYSKDGRSVAYSSFPEGILWKANRDGSNPVQLSAPPIRAMNPRWSPDGSEILFSDFQSIDPNRMYLVSSQGGGLQRLLPDDYPGNQNDPGWSADGRKIVFQGPGVDGKGELCVLDLATRKVTPIPGSAGLWSPRWSPDGKYIAAFAVQGLKVLDVATQRWSILPESRRREYNAWSSDSKFIYFLRIENGDQGVYRIRASGGKAERVADLKDWHITGSVTYWMALDPTDVPLLLRDVGSDDIYALTLEEK